METVYLNLLIQCPQCSNVMYSPDEHTVECINLRCESHRKRYHRPTINLLPVREEDAA